MLLYMLSTSSIVILISFAGNVFGLASPEEGGRRASSSNLYRRTPPNNAVCPPGGRTYGRPDLASCRNAFSLVTSTPDGTFTIPGATGGVRGFAMMVDRTLYEFGPLGATRQHPEYGTAPTPRQYTAERCLIAVEMMTGHHHGETDLASSDNLLDTAWSIIQTCVSAQGLGGYELTGVNNDIKVSIYAPNSKYDKGIRPALSKAYSSSDLSRSEIGGDRGGSASSGGEASSSSHDDSPSSQQQRGGSPGISSSSPKTRPKTRCEATACGEDGDCCENYACLRARNADTASMSVAWGVKQFLEKAVLNWCMMINDPSLS